MTVQFTQHAGITFVLNPTAETPVRAYAWGMASTVPDLVESGFAPTLNEALFQGFASAVKNHPLDVLNVYCPDESFAARLAQFNPYQHVHVSEWTANTPTGRLVLAGRKAARDLLLETYGPAEEPATEVTAAAPYFAGRPPLIIATDGSHGKSSSSWAWVTSDGDHGSGAGKASNPLSAEILAIREALKSAPKDRPVTLLSDSKWAISHARRVQEDPDCSALLECQGLPTSTLSTTQSLIRHHENVTYEWVKGHAGHPLNEAADRLAVHTRRCHEAHLPVTAQVVGRIIEDMMVANAAPLQIAS